MQSMNIIIFNDDNHEERVWINGEYAGVITDVKGIVEKTLEVVNRGEPYKCIDDVSDVNEVTVYVCDDFDDVSEDVADEIWDWFNTVENMTSDMVDIIVNKDWEALSVLI